MKLDSFGQIVSQLLILLHLVPSSIGHVSPFLICGQFGSTLMCFPM